MSLLPAVCQNCENVFLSAALADSIVKDTKLGNTNVGPCPHCGGNGLIPAGIYSFMGNIVRIVATSAEKGNEIIHIISQLTKIYEKNLNSIEFKEEIAKSIPELSSLADVLPQTRTELYAFIAIVITALTIITSHFSNTKNEDSLLTNNDMQEIVDKAVSQLSETPKNTKPNKQINTDREDAAN